ncbi:hypothetical protein [uncultured Duncaniella sp.]|uniref:hypothetical protein n=1 Tax=uncultured Duncaniella sp. TaxID=2768039 RepID=UPI0025A9AE88|nr:hypothetical protein [uncultured Duncaniella sp.]
MKKTLTLCAFALGASSAFAQLSTDRIHKFIPVTSQEFGILPGQSNLSPELHTNDIDSIAFDVDSQTFTVYGGFSFAQDREKKATYNLELLKGFELTYLMPGYMPSTCLDMQRTGNNAIRLMWRPVDDAAGYQIRYRITANEIDWTDSEKMVGDTIVGAGDSDLLIEHLEYNTTYSFAIRTLSPKGENFHSEWSTRINFGLPQWNYLSIVTYPRYIVPTVVSLVSSGVGCVTLKLNTLFDESLYSADEIAEIRSHFELNGNRFVVDKLKLRNSLTGEVKYLPVTASDLEVGEITLTDLDEGALYSVAAYNSNIRWECDAVYNSISFRSKIDSSTPIVVSSADIGTVLSEYMANDAHAENQVFYLEGGKTYTIFSNVEMSKGFTLATRPEDYAVGKRAKVGFANLSNMMLGSLSQSGNSQSPENIAPIVFDGIDFSAPAAQNYGSGSVTSNYFINSLASANPFTLQALEIRNCTFQGFIRGFVRGQGNNHVILKVKVDGNLFYNCGYYDARGQGYAWFAGPGNVTNNMFNNFEFTNNTIYDSPRSNLVTDNNKNLNWSEDTKWNIRIENNTFINFSTRSIDRHLISMRYIPGGSYMSVQRNLFVLAAEDNDTRNLYFSGADIRLVNGSGKFSFDVKDNYSVGCRDKHLANNGIFTNSSVAFSASKNSFGAFANNNNGTADDLVVKVGATPLMATDLFTNPNPPYTSHNPTSCNALDHIAPDNIMEALRYKQTPEVLNHEIYKLSIGDQRWKK